MAFVEKEFEVVNKLGLHARPAGKLVEAASRFAADIWLIRNGEEVDAKSILDVLTLACTQGTVIRVRAAGEDAEAAIGAIGELIGGKFGEE
ncbi:MAG: HPr family phosphocarrier protein [Desulfobacteraceae bacterium]|nr:MAG: HPr family phosphocarrier protein [Desulfobacteraceae bacterium]